jgi:hypothetical protein
MSFGVLDFWKLVDVVDFLYEISNDRKIVVGS